MKLLNNLNDHFIFSTKIVYNKIIKYCYSLCQALFKNIVTNSLLFELPLIIRQLDAGDTYSRNFTCLHKKFVRLFELEFESNSQFHHNQINDRLKDHL